MLTDIVSSIENLTGGFGNDSQIGEGYELAIAFMGANALSTADIVF